MQFLFAFGKLRPALVQLFSSVLELFFGFIQLALSVGDPALGILFDLLRTALRAGFCHCFQPCQHRAYRGFILLGKTVDSLGFFYHDLCFHEAVVHRLPVKGVLQHHDIERVGDTRAGVVRVVGNAGDNKAPVLQEPRRVSPGVLGFDLIPELPAHLFGKTLLHGALPRRLGQASRHHEREIDALGEADHKNVLPHLAGAHLCAGLQYRLCVRNAFDLADFCQILLVKEHGGDDLNVAEIHRVVHIRAVAAQCSVRIVDAQESCHAEEGDDND